MPKAPVCAWSLLRTRVCAGSETSLSAAAKIVDVCPHIHLGLCAACVARHQLCFMVEGIQKSGHHNQGSTSSGTPISEAGAQSKV